MEFCGGFFGAAAGVQAVGAEQTNSSITGADGVHLGQDDLPIVDARNILGSNAIIGVSTSNVEQALEAEQAGANYLGFGHLFPTTSVDFPRLSSINASRRLPA